MVAVVSAQSGQSRPASATTAASQTNLTRPAPRAVPTRAALPARGQSATTAPAAAAADVASQKALVDQYCVSCHNARLKTADLLLDQFDLAHIADHAEQGE